MTRKSITAEEIVNTQPMTDPIGDFKFYVAGSKRMEPSAVERLGALENEEMAEKIRKHDEIAAKYGTAKVCNR